MRTDSAKTETSAALPRGGVILTSQLQCLNEAGRLGKAAIFSGDCSGGVHPAFTQPGCRGGQKCLSSPSKWPGRSSDRTSSTTNAKQRKSGGAPGSTGGPAGEEGGKNPGTAIPGVARVQTKGPLK